MLEVGFVVGARCQQSHACLLAIGGYGLDAVHQRLVAGSQALHLHAGKCFGKLPRNGNAVFKQIPQARRCLCALRHHTPVAIGATGQVKGGYVQPGVAQRFHAVHGTQVARVAQHQGGGQHGTLQKGLRAVDVGQHGVEQAGALQHPGFYLGPASGCDHHREQVKRPRTLSTVCRIGIHVVGHTVVAKLAGQALGAAVQLVDAVCAHMAEKRRPLRAQVLGGGVAQLVQVAGIGVQRHVQGQGNRVGRGVYR